MPLDHYRYAVVGCMSRLRIDLARLPDMMPADRAHSLVLRARFADDDAAQAGGRASRGGSGGSGGSSSGSSVRSLFSREQLGTFVRSAATSFGKRVGGGAAQLLNQAARARPQRPAFGIGGGLGGVPAGLRVPGH